MHWLIEKVVQFYELATRAAFCCRSNSYIVAVMLIKWL